MPVPDYTPIGKCAFCDLELGDTAIEVINEYGTTWACGLCNQVAPMPPHMRVSRQVEPRHYTEENVA